MSRFLLIDLDGVIRTWDEAKPEYCGVPTNSITQIAFQPELLNSVITGQITDDEWRLQISSSLANEFGAESTAAVAAWSESPGVINNEVWNLLTKSRYHDKMVLVTNATDRLEADLAQLGVARSFFAIINSSTVGAAKPNSTIYQYALNTVGCTSCEAIFVDDQPRNVEAAIRLGLTGHVFKSIGGLKQFLEC